MGSSNIPASVFQVPVTIKYIYAITPSKGRLFLNGILFAYLCLYVFKFREPLLSMEPSGQPRRLRKGRSLTRKAKAERSSNLRREKEFYSH